MGEEGVEKSEYNIALETSQFIRLLLTTSSFHLINRNLHSCFDTLMSLSLEIDYLLKDNELKELDKIKEELTKLDNIYIIFKDKGKIKDFKDYGKYYDKLRDFQRFLRKCFHSRDMLIKTKDDPRRAMTKTD